MPTATFSALRVGWLVNLGAYCSSAGPFINTAASPTSMAGNVYRTPAFYGLNRLVFTNADAGAPYRGAGRPNVSYLIERLVDEAARSTGIDRIELRRRNLLARDAFPYKTPTGSTYDSGDPAGLLDAGAAGCGLERLRAPACRGEGTRPAARHRLRDLHRAIRRRRAGGDRDQVRRRRSGRSCTRLPGRPGRATRQCTPSWSPAFSASSADKITLRYSDPDGPAARRHRHRSARAR